MCWSIQASAALATAGFSTSGYIAHKGEDKHLWIPLAYFSLMELLQAVSYFYIDQCGLYMNQLLTILGYIHIAFQPFFINAFSLYFVPKEIRKKVSPWVYAACFAGTVVMLVKLYPFNIVSGSMAACVPGAEAMCASSLCTVTGTWHLAWDIPLSMYPHNFYGYLITGFILPLLYGSWRVTIYHIVVGPFLARMLTSNPNEWAAVWCLLSIGYIFIGLSPPVRKMLHVKHWFLWRLLKRAD